MKTEVKIYQKNYFFFNKLPFKFNFLNKLFDTTSVLYKLSNLLVYVEYIIFTAQRERDEHCSLSNDKNKTILLIDYMMRLFL